MLIRIQSHRNLDGFANFTGNELETFIKLLSKIIKPESRHLDKNYWVLTEDHTIKSTFEVVMDDTPMIAEEQYDRVKAAWEIGRQQERAAAVAPLFANPEARASDEALFDILANQNYLYSSERKSAYVFGETDNGEIHIRGTSYQDKPFDMLVKRNGDVEMKRS